MRQLLRTALLAAPVAVAVLAVGPERTARADAAGDAALAKVDDAMNRAKTHQFEYDVTNQEAGKAETKLAMRVQMKGEKRQTEFLAPADMKGTKVLILSPDQKYVYLPAFGKVRRIASSVGDQGFMGMTFSQDDFVTKYTSCSRRRPARRRPTRRSSSPPRRTASSRPRSSSSTRPAST
jgi:hypothetical protein